MWASTWPIKKSMSACFGVCMLSYALPARTNGEIVVLLMGDGERLVSNQESFVAFMIV